VKVTCTYTFVLISCSSGRTVVVIFEVFTVEVVRAVFFVSTLCSLASGYQHFGGTCCLHLEVKLESRL
jgi:hypothetical protein